MKNLNYVASLVQLDLDDYTTHLRTKILQYCVDCYKGVLNYKTASCVNVAYLTPNDVNNAAFPKDYEYYTKIGINVGGQIVTLTLNPDIPLVRKYDCGVEAQDPSQIDWNRFDPGIYYAGFNFAPHYRNGQFVGEMYGVGGGFNSLGYFRVDKKLRQFQFYNIPKTEIILEYVGDDKTNGSTLIPYMDVDPIRTFVLWKLIDNKMGIPQSEKDRKFWAHNAALQKRIKLEFAPTMSDYLDVCYAGYKSSPKR